MPNQTEDVKSLKRKLATIKTRVTKFKNFITIPQNQNKYIEVKNRLKDIIPCLQEFRDLHSQILEIDESQITDDELTQFEDEFYAVTSDAEALAPSNVSATAETLNSPSQIRPDAPPVKLPDISIPKFNGLFTEWIGFRDSFSSLIHENASLSAIQKFHYLKGSLIGDASQTIAHLAPSMNNYSSAWQLIQQRYENKRLITQHHVRALFSLPQSSHKDFKMLRQLLDSVTTHIKALESIGRPVDQWDDLLIHLITSKFDNNSMMAWETTLNNALPTFNDITKFMTQRCQMLDSIEINNSLAKSYTSHQIRGPSSHISTNSTKMQPIKCVICSDPHNLYQCSQFRNMSPEHRLQEVKKHRLCTNCLRGGHKTESCSGSNCKKCNKRHNSLLHFDNASVETSTSSPNLIATASHYAEPIYNNVILSTAMVSVLSKKGQKVNLRALLDNGSASNFITERAVKMLKLDNVTKVNFSITGIACSISKIDKAVRIKLHSDHNNFNREITCLIVPQITDNIPTESFEPISEIPKNIKLADPLYYQSNFIDVLIGSEMFWSLICVGQIRLRKNGPILQKTQLGWIISGPLFNTNFNGRKFQCNISNIQLNEAVRKFWQLEELSGNNLNNTDIAETHFAETVTRAPSGRFTVKLPLINDPPKIGISHDKVLRMFYNLERRLQRDRHLQAQYIQFMQDYLELGHMSQVKPDHSGYFVPHHSVINEASTTTKLRVVFNASYKTNNNQSINDNLLVGPKLQQDLFCILIRFRIHKIIITADIKKMYRQIQLHSDHRKYQQIFWRNTPDEPIKTYQLHTVTYGFASSSFLAARCLQELASAEEKSHPKAAEVILRDFYVDDLITGADTVENANAIFKEINTILNKGGFELHKIHSNQLSISDRAMENNISLDKQPTTKTLGVIWDCDSDTIKYSIHLKPNQSKTITKREILSVIARIFDPLGLVGPATISGKIIMQKLWATKLNWDESLPIELHTTWNYFLQNFHALGDIRIPRLVISHQNHIEIHGFCDASQRAFGACVYLRAKISDGNYQTQLLCSKNKVAPLSGLTVPRLELCGALLLTRLVNKIKKSLHITIQDCHYWSDSSIILAWINMSPGQLKPFIAHRIAEIQDSSTSNKWHHVRSAENPADILSRGATPETLASSKLWWHGPGFLKTETIYKNNNDNKPDNIPEMRTACCLSLQPKSEQILDLVTRFSSFQKLIRIIALIRRFYHNIKNKICKTVGPLTTKELKMAHDLIIKAVQNQEFIKEIHNLRKHGGIPSDSKIQNLNPYLDETDLLRVGGRLKHANLNTDQKHPLLLPKNHFITKLIIEKTHVENLHSGCEATLSAVRQKYWPISARDSRRTIIHKCVKCYRLNPIAYEQLMADLPKDRVTPTRPFTVTGVDYAGPFTLKNGHGRTTRTIKGYIVIFVCFATRAMHIELVCECTSSAFLNALKRFIARRGKPRCIYSDNGTNFVGANKKLKELSSLLKSKTFSNSVIDALANDCISWHFIPPRSPHMGGLWEAAVKSVKSHLKRVLGDRMLNFEEMYTLLAMIEACFNSRPITPLSNDAHDLTSLTLEHFLIGTPLRHPPKTT
jgi:transposase InsO family protein